MSLVTNGSFLTGDLTGWLSASSAVPPMPPVADPTGQLDSIFQQPLSGQGSLARLLLSCRRARIPCSSTSTQQDPLLHCAVTRWQLVRRLLTLRSLRPVFGPSIPWFIPQEFPAHRWSSSSLAQLGSLRELMTRSMSIKCASLPTLSATPQEP